MEAVTSFPTSLRAIPNNIPIFWNANVTVKSAANAIPCTSPVSVESPDGMSTATFMASI